MSEIINHKDIKTTTNWVLVKPSQQLEKYHLNGKETSIFVGNSHMKYVDPEDSIDFDQVETVDTQAQHYPISGEVIAIPDRNVFYGFEVKKIMSLADDQITPDDIRIANEMAQASLKVRSDVNVSVGDTVLFDYMININCYQNGLWFKTEIGDLFLVRYDDLIGRINDQGVKPLNGNVFFEWQKKLKSGSIELLDHEIHEAKGIQKGVVTYVSEDPRYYLNGVVFLDFPTEISVGDRFIYDPIDCSMIESQDHLTIFGGKEIYTIKRKDCIAKIE